MAASAEPRKIPTTERKGKILGVTISAALGGLLFGFDTSVINGAVNAIQNEFGLNPEVLGFTVAITLLGCAAGAWFAGQLADIIGRKKVMTLAAILFTLSSIGSGFAFATWDLMLWRLIGGIGIGIASVIAPTYIAEVVPARVRGGLASLQQLAITLGIFLALLMDAYFAISAGNASKVFLWGLPAWRWMLLVGVVPAVVYGLLSLRIPESPHYLVRKGRYAEAGRVITSFSGNPAPEKRISEIRDSFEEEGKTSYRDLRGPALGLQPILWVGFIMAALQQLVGINAIFYYSNTLWASVGFSTKDSFITSVITSIINVVMTFVAILFVDRIGRKRLLFWGSWGMFVGLLAAAISFTHAETGSGNNVVLAQPWGFIALAGANIFVIFFAATWGPIMWVALGEIFPNKIRTLALGLGSMVNWIFNFIVTLLFPPLSTTVGLGYLYGGFAFFAVLSVFFVVRAFPDVTGKELEDKTKLEHTTVHRHGHGFAH